MSNQIILPYELINHILSYRPSHPIAKIIKGTYHPVAKLIQKFITMYNYTELKNIIDTDQYEKYYNPVSFYHYWSKNKDFYRLEHIRFIEYKHKFTIPPSFDITYASHLEYAKSRKITLSQLASEHWIEYYKQGLSDELIKSN